MTSNQDLNKDMLRFPLGQVEKLANGSAILTLTRDYAATPERVWSMLTEPANTQLWWCKVRGRAESGSSFDLKWLNVRDELGKPGETDWWNGRVIEADGPKKLEIANAMHGTIGIELEPHGTGTHVVFTNTIDVPEEVILMSLAGWHVHLDHLQEALEGKGVDWQNWWTDFYPGWEQIHSEYQKRQN